MRQGEGGAADRGGGGVRRRRARAARGRPPSAWSAAEAALARRGDRRADRRRRRDADGLYGAPTPARPSRSAAGDARRLHRRRPGRRTARPDARARCSPPGSRRCAERPVRLRSVAPAGARSQRPGAPGRRWCSPTAGPGRRRDHDRRQRRDPPGAAADRRAAPRRRRCAGCGDAGAEVVVGTCPDLGTIEPVPQPLRWIARRASRQLAAAQTIAVGRGGRPHGVAGRPARAGVRGVPRGDVRAGPLPPLGGGLRERRGGPAALGLRRARRLVGGEPEAAPDLGRGEGVRPVAQAAVGGGRRGRHRGRRRPGRRPGPRAARPAGRVLRRRPRRQLGTDVQADRAGRTRR